MASNNSFSIRPLDAADSTALANLIRSQSPEYLRFFYAFGSSESELTQILQNSKKDVFSGIFWEDEMVGIFFLRGWDAGYEIPSFGVLIAEKYRGKAFLNLTVDTAKLICKLTGINRYMVKIHPENTALQNVRRMGFYQTGVEEKTGNVIFHLDF